MSEPTATGNDSTIPIAPELFVRDIDASLRFYVEQLSFRTVRRESGFAVVALGGAHLLLATPDESVPAMGSWLASGPRGVGLNIRIMVDAVDALYQLASDRGATVIQEIDDRVYGLRDFIIADPDGFLLRFASPIER